jgi:acyl dehydratase
LPFLATAVGARHHPREVDLTARDLLSFAAGIDAPWPEALDDARPEGLTGFPTYCASLEFNAFQSDYEAGGNPAGTDVVERRRGVHAGQDSAFHAPLRPGDRLSTTGTVTGVRHSSAGVVVTRRAETVNRDTGAPVVTSWVTQILRGVALAGAPAEVAVPPPQPAPPRERIVRRTEVQVTAAMPHVYAECSDIWNPIHSERSVARSAGLPDIILQGTAIWSFAARELVDALCRGDAQRLARLGCRFVGMALPGDVLAIEVFEPSGGAAAFDVTRLDGAPILRGGFAELRGENPQPDLRSP